MQYQIVNVDIVNVVLFDFFIRKILNRVEVVGSVESVARRE